MSESKKRAYMVWRAGDHEARAYEADSEWEAAFLGMVESLGRGRPQRAQRYVVDVMVADSFQGTVKRFGWDLRSARDEAPAETPPIRSALLPLYDLAEEWREHENAGNSHQAADALIMRLDRIWGTKKNRGPSDG